MKKPTSPSIFTLVRYANVPSTPNAFVQTYMAYVPVQSCLRLRRHRGRNVQHHHTWCTMSGGPIGVPSMVGIMFRCEMRSVPSLGIMGRCTAHEHPAHACGRLLPSGRTVLGCVIAHDKGTTHRTCTGPMAKGIESRSRKKKKQGCFGWMHTHTNDIHHGGHLGQC